MKALFTALILSTLAAPVLALQLPQAASDTGIAAPSSDEFGRRSGRCPHRPEAPLIAGQNIARSGSTCGGV
jgi:hypothetical protein